MKRQLLSRLVQWKESPNRKPLILQGARQTGKTWLLKEFGKTYYANMAVFNFEETPSLASLFSGSLDPKPILEALSALHGARLYPRDTLIIFDEIQEASRVVTSLKYFAENASEYHIACAGSLLGISMSSGDSFPVGKTDFVDLHPLSFDEFLMAAGEEELIAYLRSRCLIDAVPEPMVEKLIGYLKTYFITGGMPGPLSVWFETKDFTELEVAQKNLLFAYENDFAKHAPGHEIPKLRRIWDSIPAQLGRENKKFLYSDLKKGGRSTEFEDALHWLVHAGLIHQIFRATAPGFPLSAYDDSRSFKLFMHDVGLLRVKAGLPVSALAEGNRLFTEFKGALTENFALNEMIAAGYHPLKYWTSDAQAEVDFLVQTETNVLPMEVKSSINVKSRSLQIFREHYHPPMMLRSSLLNLRRNGDILNIPLYCLFYMNEVIDRSKRGA
jgi:predicted AAA+ superfamily ATPase